jgi:small subunit ribosomal protein S15
MKLDKSIKTEVINKFKKHDGDTGSPEVQVGILTSRIVQLTDHLRLHKHDESTRHGLLRLVGRRNKLLTYIQKKDNEGYIKITDELNIRRRK